MKSRRMKRSTKMKFFFKFGHDRVTELIIIFTMESKSHGKGDNKVEVRLGQITRTQSRVEVDLEWKLKRK